MPLNIGWDEIALRLMLTVVAGLLIGYNRTEHGKAVGLRTTLLVRLAASVAMIKVNLLLPTAGRAFDSFVMNDLMRFPLGMRIGAFLGLHGTFDKRSSGSPARPRAEALLYDDPRARKRVVLKPVLNGAGSGLEPKRPPAERNIC
jgi:hypothetical protein